YVSDAKDARFIGLEKAEAVALAEKFELQWRVVRQDEVVNPVLMRLQDDRLNFVIAGGQIIRVRRG
ncbi:MAG: hypothetical protein ACR2RV_29045, partial [Verrucomicrobiales bacterium]